MSNPFVFGEVVKGENFANRRKEIEELASDLRSGQNIVMYSPRQYGKTSLIMRVLDELQGEAIGIYCDLMKVTTKERFAELYGSAIASASGRLEELAMFLKEHLPTIEPKITLKPDEKVAIELGLGRREKDIDAVLERLYDLPQRLAEWKGKPVVVVFDEFQEAVALNGEAMLRAMRAKIQHHAEVTYVFTGSKKHLFRRIFTDENMALYGIGKFLPLRRIPEDEFCEFIIGRFITTGIKVNRKLCWKIIEITQCHPAFTQQLCHTLWYIAQGKSEVSLADIGEAERKVMASRAPIYEMLWDSLNPRQRSLLVAIAEGSTELYSRETVDNYSLGSSSNVQKLIKALEKREVIERKRKGYGLTDGFFKKWLLQERI